MVLLTTRGKKLDEDDWEKLKQVLKYIKGTRELKLTLSVGDISIMKCLGRLFVRSARRLLMIQKIHDVPGQGISVQFIHEKNHKWKELHIGLIDWCRRRYGKILWPRYFIEA